MYDKFWDLVVVPFLNKSGVVDSNSVNPPLLSKSEVREAIDKVYVLYDYIIVFLKGILYME
jgi:hypothetical protein